MKRTLTQLEAVLVKERKEAQRSGAYGLDECKKEIKWQLEYSKTTLEDLYVQYIKRGLTETLFNTYMIIACEQLMEEQKN